MSKIFIIQVKNRKQGQILQRKDTINKYNNFIQ